MVLLGLATMALGIGVLGGGSESNADELGGDWLAPDRLWVASVDIAALGLWWLAEF